MADKQVNININYKVNTVEVEKAQVLLKQAQSASNTFEQSAKKAGTTTSQAFKAAGSSIQDMNAKLVVLKEIITQSSDPKTIKRLSDEYKRLKTQIDDANKSAFQTPKALNESSAATKSLAGQFGQLYTAIKLVLTAGLIKEIATTAIEMAKLSGNIDGVGRAFNRTFPNAETLLFGLRKATHGTVSDFDLMQKALKAQNLGVPVQEFAKLLEFAATRAQQTGDSVDYLVNSIVDGLGRKSILKLDNLGVSATRIKEAMGGISLQAASVAQVTEAFTKVAGEELQKMGGYAETSATQVDQLTVSFQKLRQELSQAVGASSFVTFVKGYVDSFALLLEARRNGNTVAEQSQENQRKEIANLSAADFQQRVLTKSKEENNKALEEEIKLLTTDIGKWTAFRDVQEEAILTLKEDAEAVKDDLKQKKISYSEAAKQIQSIKDEIKFREKLRDANKEDALTRQELLKIYIGMLAAGKKTTETEKEQLGIIESLQDEIEILGDKIKKAHSVQDIENYNRQLVLLEAKLKDLNELGKNFVNPFASQVFDIKAKVSTGKVKLKPGDIMDTASLEADTTKLFEDLGKKAGESFSLGTASGITDLQRVFNAAKDDLEVAAIDITANSLLTIQEMELDSLNIRINNLTKFYDRQQLLAGDNEKAKDQLRLREMDQVDALRKKQAEKEKRAALFNIIINTAASIAKTAATLGFPAAIPAIIIAAATGAAQLALVNQQSTGFAKGVLNLNGKGNGTSDSIPARLSKGESVMTANEWKTSKNVLKEVRAKKLDDKVLADLKLGKDGVKYVGGFNDKNLLSKLDEVKNSFPDIEERSGLIYTTKKKGENYRMWVRKSSMSS